FTVDGEYVATNGRAVETRMGLAWRKVFEAVPKKGFSPSFERGGGGTGPIPARLTPGDHRSLSLFLSNVHSLDNKLDLLRLRLGVSREMRNCAVLCLMETWLNDNMPDPAFQIDGRLLSIRADRNQQSGKARTGADYAST
ncbi:hypothetical protein L3Q82_005158, partial [Scortum barcoo]